ncbi:MAG TPA: efflux RND transporter periplasmic adaptor subunit, partial [Acetobacteraceae bacterium]|nr:efflux RND transporter periplasmic adaptor subunit [Acetobacteraceae bacterium]
GESRPPARRRGWWRTLALVGVLVTLAAVGGDRIWRSGEQPAAPPPPPPQVTVSLPLRQAVQATGRFLGQFSAVDSVELRAQVGGTLTAIEFQDGQIVHKGDPLFVIDPRPFQIRLDQAVAQLQTAQAKEALSEAELWRAQQLKRTDFGTAESVDQRAADQRSAQAAIDTARAAIRDARLDLEFSRVTAPFTGRIGAHLVSVGSLVSGSRGGSGPTTLLATVVSLDPIHLDFDMSESDYLDYQQAHRGSAPHDDVDISLAGDGHFDRHGKLDFIDNAVNRGSGTIHARVTVPNPDLMLTPGQFARLRVKLGDPAPALLVPAAAVIPDQSRQIVMTVAADGTIVPKVVEIGDLYRGLRVIRDGLSADDRVVINGVVRVRPGIKVTPVPGAITPDPPAGDAG